MEFKNIENFENYKIFKNGDIIGARGKILKEDTNSTGYKRVTLSKDGVTTRRFVHQLVAEHFLSCGDDKLVVNHIDGDRINNDASNLEYVTHSYNVKDGFKRGRVPPMKYQGDTLQQLRTYFDNGKGHTETARELKLDCGTVYKYFKEFRERATTIPQGSTLQAIGNGSA